MPMQEYVDRLQRIERLEILAVDVQTWLDNLELPWEHRDPADRTIVALATLLGCPLVTSDKLIAGFIRKWFGKPLSWVYRFFVFLVPFYSTTSEVMVSEPARGKSLK